MPIGGPHTIRTGVASADDDDILSGRKYFLAYYVALDGGLFKWILARHPLIILLQIIHRIVNAFELAAGNIEIPRHGRSTRQYDRIEFAEKINDADIDSNIGMTLKDHTLFLHQVDPSVNHPFLEFEIGNAIAKQTTGCVVSFIHGDEMTRII